MKPLAIPPLAAAMVTLLVGTFVWSRDRRATVNRTFLGFTTAVALWLYSYAQVSDAREPTTALWWARTAYLGVPFIAPCILHATIAFLGRHDLRWLWKVGYVTGVVALPFTRSDLFLSHTQQFWWGYYPAAGPLYPFTLVSFMACYSAAMVILVWEMKRGIANPQVNLQAKYWLIGFLVAFGGAVDFLPKYGFEVYPWGYAHVVGYLVIASYSIVRHRLLGIDMVIKRTVIFAGLVSLVVAVVSAVTFVSQELLGELLPIQRWTANLVSALVVALAYAPIYRGLSVLTERHLFQQKHDMRKLLRAFTDEVVSVLDLDAFVALTSDSISRTVKPKSVVLLLRDDETGAYVSRGGGDRRVLNLSCEGDGDWLSVPRRFDPRADVPVELAARLEDMEPAVSLPLLANEVLIGLLVLGKKKSDQEYADDELDILSAMAKTLGISLNNARQTTALAEALERAEELSKLKSQFLARVSHELRTPLNSIINLPQALVEEFSEASGLRCRACRATFLIEEGEVVDPSTQPCADCGQLSLAPETFTEFHGDPAETAACLRTIHRAGSHLLAVVNDVLDFSKIEARYMELSRSHVDLFQVIADVRDAVQGSAVARDVRVRFVNVLAGQHVLHADHLRVVQILVNLVGNAIKFSRPGSSVQVEVERLGQFCQVAVRDEGPGIAESDHALIFESFRQVEGGTTRTHGGTGLGLAISKQLVELHGGSLWVESRLGAGARFVFRLPYPVGEGVSGRSSNLEPPLLTSADTNGGSVMLTAG